jgi:hypothetical protein
VLAFRHIHRTMLIAAGAFALAAAAGTAVRAQGKLEARYEATLAGIPIGKGNWVVEIGDTHYSTAASGVTTGLIRVFTGGEGSSAAQGVISDGKLMSATYTATIRTSHRTDKIRLVVADGSVKEFKVDPPIDTDPERVPITEANQRGIVDPMSGSLLQVSGTGDMLAPASCQRTLAVFDGRLRYDLALAYKRIEQVKADKGYSGPVLVCAISFTPVAGFIPSRTTIKYIAKLRDIEVWLAPIAGTRVLAPFRFQGPTPIGQFRLEAHQFVSVAGPVRASINGAKTQ